MQVLILSVPCLRELPLECQVPLSRNFMGYIFTIIELSGDEIKFALKWFWSKIITCEVVSLSLTVIGREDCRKIGAIAVSSSGLGKRSLCFCGEVCSFFLIFFHFSSQHILTVTLFVWGEGGWCSFLQLSYSQYGSNLEWISLTNQKHQSLSQKVYLHP